MKNYLLLTLIALCPVTTQAMEEPMSVAHKNERIAQLQVELAQLQAADVEAPNTPVRRRSPISMRGIQAAEPQPAPAAQNMQDNESTRCERIGCGIGITGGAILGLGAFGTAMWACVKYCPKSQAEKDCDQRYPNDAANRSACINASQLP